MLDNEVFLNNKRFCKQIHTIHAVRTPDTCGGKLSRIKYSPVSNPKIITWMFLPPTKLSMIEKDVDNVFP